MLEDFQAHGLAGAAVDFGPLILLFSKRQAGNFTFQPAGLARVGADEAFVLAYRQSGGESNLTVFAGRKTVRQPLEGRVFLRKPDGLPLRVTMRAARAEDGRKVVEEATVDYVMTPHGYLAPAAVTAPHPPRRPHPGRKPLPLHGLPQIRRRQRNQVHGGARSQMKYIYLHGFASGPGSTKARFFRDRFAEAGRELRVPDLAAGDFEHLTITANWPSSKPPPPAPRPC